MSSEVLVPQVALADRDRGDSTAVGDDVAISVRNVGKMYYLALPLWSFPGHFGGENG